MDDDTKGFLWMVFWACFFIFAIGMVTLLVIKIASLVLGG